MYKETIYVGETRSHSQYKIIDSDFEVIDPGDKWIANNIIEVYEERGLNVAANLALAFIWNCDQHGWKIENIIKNTKENVPRYAKYADDVEKYLTLI